MNVNNMTYITDRLTEEELADMVIEECAKLTQALCKFKRLRSNNHTPKKEKEVMESIDEELIDTHLAMEILMHKFSTDNFMPLEVLERIEEKLERWVARLKDNDKDKL